MKKVMFVFFILSSLLSWGKTYSTAFPLNENPISESGNWINGGTAGLDWTNMETTGGLAYGTESGTAGSGGVDDSTAVLTGTWGQNQTVTAVVHAVNLQQCPANCGSNVVEELELRLNTTITAHSITGYEIVFRVLNDGRQYCGVVRWNGPYGDFTDVGTTVTCPGLHDGDQIMASRTASNAISVYINSTLVATSTDSTYLGGAPGIGWFYQFPSGTSNRTDYGFTSFTATDNASQAPAPPTNLKSVVH